MLVNCKLYCISFKSGTFHWQPGIDYGMNLAAIADLHAYISQQHLVAWRDRLLEHQFSMATGDRSIAATVYSTVSTGPLELRVAEAESTAVHVAFHFIIRWKLLNGHCTAIKPHRGRETCVFVHTLWC